MNKERKPIILRLAILCLLPLLASQSGATVLRKPVSTSVVEYGIYEDRGQQQKFTSPGSAAGTVSRASERIRFVNQTNEIPLKKGVMFGYKWRMQGLVPGKSFNVTYRIKHPPIVNSKGIPMDKSEGMIKVTPNRDFIEMLNAYQLTKDNELVPGTWTITTLLDEEIIAEMSFQVIVQ
ncbi:MAG: DUF3859 domain-containing protein [Nitrospirota bacterium]